MRVALSLMRRNEKNIMACNELEDVMGLLLSRALWDTYNCDADDLVNDFVGLTGLVTREGLENLEGFLQRQEQRGSSCERRFHPHHTGSCIEVSWTVLDGCEFSFDILRKSHFTYLESGGSRPIPTIELSAEDSFKAEHGIYA